MPADMDNTAFAGDHVVETLAIPELDGDHLVAGTGLTLPAQIFRPFAGDWNQTLH